MSLYKRRNVYWSAVYVDGVRHLRSLETTNRRKAETREEAIKDELRARHFQLPELRPEMTFDELYTRFLAEGGVRPHHIERAKHFLPFFGDLSIGGSPRTKRSATGSRGRTIILPNKMARTHPGRCPRQPSTGISPSSATFSTGRLTKVSSSRTLRRVRMAASGGSAGRDAGR